MLALLLPALLLQAGHARPDDRCAQAPWYVATAVLDAATLPAGVEVVAQGYLPRLANRSSTPLDLLDPDLAPIDRLVDGKAFHWFARGVPVEGMQHLVGWQNPYDIDSALLNVPPPAAMTAGPGRPPELTPPPPEAFAVPTFHGPDLVVLRGVWQFDLDPGYDAALCATP